MEMLMKMKTNAKNRNNSNKKKKNVQLKMFRYCENGKKFSVCPWPRLKITTELRECIDNRIDFYCLIRIIAAAAAAFFQVACKIYYHTPSESIIKKMTSLLVFTPINSLLRCDVSYTLIESDLLPPIEFRVEQIFFFPLLLQQNRISRLKVSALAREEKKRKDWK